MEMSAIPASELDSCGPGSKGICFGVCFLCFHGVTTVTVVLLTLRNVSETGWVYIR